jgi:molecular chaperone GrpE
MDRIWEKSHDLEDMEKQAKGRSKEKRAKKLGEMTKQELLEQLKDIEAEAKKNHDLYLRAYAEMENIKKRGKKEREDLAKYANESLIKEILPVIDNLEKAISHSKNGDNPSGLIEGIELTLDGLIKTLEKAGLEEVESEGKPFDPNFHEAVSQQIDEFLAPGHIITELQKGYLLNGRLIRPSRVIISQGSSETSEESI